MRQNHICGMMHTREGTTYVPKTPIRVRNPTDGPEQIERPILRVVQAEDTPDIDRSIRSHVDRFTDTTNSNGYRERSRSEISCDLVTPVHHGRAIRMEFLHNN